MVYGVVVGGVLFECGDVLLSFCDFLGELLYLLGELLCFFMEVFLVFEVFFFFEEFFVVLFFLCGGFVELLYGVLELFLLLCVLCDVFLDVLELFFVGGELLLVEVCFFCLCGGVVEVFGEVFGEVLFVFGVGFDVGDDGVEFVDVEHAEDEWSSFAGVHGGECVEFFLFGENGGVEAFEVHAEGFFDVFGDGFCAGCDDFVVSGGGCVGGVCFAVHFSGDSDGVVVEYEFEFGAAGVFGCGVFSFDLFGWCSCCDWSVEGPGDCFEYG